MDYSGAPRVVRNVCWCVMPTACLVSSYSPSLINFRGPLIEALQARGYSVVALGPRDDDVALQLAERGVQFVRVGPQRTSTNPFADFGYFLKLIAVFRRVRPDLVLSYTAKPVIWASIAARVANTPNICAMITGLGSIFTGGLLGARVLRRTLRCLYRVSLRNCRRVVFQNPDDCQDFLAYGLVEPHQTHVVGGSGIDLKRFELRPLAERCVYLLIARLIADKGIREYVSAARQLRERYPHCEFRIVGWFDENPSAISRAEVDVWIKKGWITYRGAVDDVRPEIAGCRIYVLPSYREGTPRTVLEAMAIGRPIVTTDVPGCRETVRDGWNGYLVPKGDVSALAYAMERFLLQPELCELMARRSRELAERKYEANAVARSLLDGIGA